MKKIVFTLVALAGLLSATEYVQIDNTIVRVSQNQYIVGVFSLKDVAYMTQIDGGRNIVVLKQPSNAVIEITDKVNHNNIGAAFANYLAAQK